MSERHLGKATNRVDAPLKVQGQARYAAEYPQDQLIYGVVVNARVARGRLKAIDDGAALAVPGVVAVLTHENRPSMAWFNRSYNDQDAPGGEHFRPLYDAEIHFNHQPIALVLADSLEAARLGASLVKASYAEASHITDLRANLDLAREVRRRKPGFEQPKSRGDVAAGFAAAAAIVDASYSTPIEHHNPMEMHASTVRWDGAGKLTIYDKTQGVQNCQAYICSVFGLDPDDVQVLAPYVGGAFGSGLRPQHQLLLAAMAALKLERAVRVELTREQMFSFGHRPATEQRLKIGARADGTLTALLHHTVCTTSRLEDYADNVVTWSAVAYTCPNVDLAHKVLPLDLHSPLDMRAPGAAVGMFALESAIDELAHQLAMDPFELRSRNYAERDQAHLGRSFSTKQLAACYTKGAERFGWARRELAPRSMRDGHKLIGWGMATGIWEAAVMPTRAKATLQANGRLEISCASVDMGTGTYTVMSQVAAEAFGLELDLVDAKLGDSQLSPAPLSGGSWTAASVGGAVADACYGLQEKLFKLARSVDDSPFAGMRLSDVEFSDGLIRLKTMPNVRLRLTDLMQWTHTPSLAVEGSEAPSKVQQLLHGMFTHSAVFVEAQVDADLGMIEIPRVVCAVDAGRILNPKTARSQIIGGVVWGIGMALHEQSLIDPHLGRLMNHSFAEYHVPVMKDIGSIDVLFIEEADYHVGSLGVKGLGEIGVVGTAAAVANAVFHATGQRVRQLPITPDKLL